MRRIFVGLLFNLLNFGLKVAILRSGMRQPKVAADVGLSERRLSSVITGRISPLENEVAHLERAFGQMRSELGFELASVV